MKQFLFRPAIILIFAIVALFNISSGLEVAVAACPQHPKSAAGLMPPACVLDPNAPARASVAGAPAAPFLNPAVSVPTGSWPQVLGAADFDGAAGDGRSQLAVATERYFDLANDRQIHLFAVGGAGAPQRIQQLPAGVSPEAAQPLDVNHDGASDLVLALTGENALAVYLSGAGPLASPTRIALSASADALAAVDVNGDGHDDLVAVVGNTLRFWRSSPTGLAALPLSLDYPNHGYNALAVGDFNDDGYADIAAMRGAGYQTDAVALFFQQGETFVASPSLNPRLDGFVPSAIAVGDLDGDGQDDLAVTSGGNVPNAYLSLFYQRGGVLDPNPVVLNTYHLPSAIAAADINHDGREDLVLTDDGWRTISIFAQQADATFDPAYLAADIPYSDRYRPDALAVTDIDGNGSLDVALVGQPQGLTVLTGVMSVPRATITEPAEATTVPAGYVPVLGTASTEAVAVQVRVKGLSDWQEVPVTSGAWQAMVALPSNPRPYTIEARALDAARHVQAPPTTRHVKTTLVCYALADNGTRHGSPDRLVQVNMQTAAATVLGATGTREMHALAFRPGSSTLYATDDGYLGTISLSTRAFTRIGPSIGKGRGAQGTITLDNVQGLSFDPIHGALYAISRREKPGQADVLFQVDPISGTLVTDAFYAGVDYVPVSGPGVLADVDDIAFDASGALYGVSNKNGAGGALITITPATGAATAIGPLRVNDIEGFTIAPSGTFYGTTGVGWSATRDRLWTINAEGGVATLVGQFGMESDYEAIACLPLGAVLSTNAQAFQPQLVDLSINDAAAETTSSQVTVRAAALISPGVTTPTAVLLAEYGYNQARQAWQPVGLLQRVGAGAAAEGIAWSLGATPGMHYLQAWAIDASGRVVRPAQQAFINYLPDQASIAAGERQIFRYTLAQREALDITLTALNGSVNLAVWGNHSTEPIAAGADAGSVAHVTLTAGSDGLYQIEVLGVSDATYRLAVARALPAPLSLSRAGGEAAPQGVPASIATTAAMTQPHIPLSSEPDRDATPVSAGQLYLPLIRR